MSTQNTLSALPEMDVFPGTLIDPRELVLSRVIDAPQERLFEAWTNPSQLARWWGPHGMTIPDCQIDLRPGGAFRTVMRAPDGTEYPTKGVFLEIAPPERIVFTDAFEPGFQPTPEPFITTVVTFEAFGGKTKFTARALHKSTADRERHQQMGFYQGWSESLDRLTTCLAKFVNP